MKSRGRFPTPSTSRAFLSEVRAPWSLVLSTQSLVRATLRVNLSTLSVVRAVLRAGRVIKTC